LPDDPARALRTTKRFCFAAELFNFHPMPLPILSISQMREWESATWATGQTEKAVIAAVGEHLARRAMSMTRPGETILLLAGKGHNGDDARAMLPGLVNRDARLLRVHDPRAVLPELTPALRRRPRLIVDALFGIGLNRDLGSPWADFIARVNHAQLIALAIDVPSGLDAETGRALPVAIRARVTVTIGAPKKGLLSPHAAEWVGQLEVASDVGLNPYPFHSETQWTIESDFSGYPPRRFVASHKGTFGHVAIVGGSLGYHGAAILAARGAQRARPGLVTLVTPADVYNPIAAQCQAVMVHPWNDEFDWPRFTAILCGPGLAAANLPPGIGRTLQQLWANSEHPLIVDASALSWLPEGGTSINGLNRVITPHPREAARLLGCSVAEVQEDRANAVRALSKRFGQCWVVLKGLHTMIGRAEGDIFVNSSGNAGLAQGGTGDLLAGYIAGWLAQPELQADPGRAIRYAVWEHGRAADRLTLTRENWTVEELAVALGPLHSA
jgi:hydroxyethylthiazole kinase-like uncharacterized protein yjeF